MIATVTAGGAQITIVVKHITSVMEMTTGTLSVTLIGGDKLSIQADYSEFVAEIAKMV